MTTVTREELDAVRNHIRNIPTIGAMYAPVLVEWCAVLLRERDEARADAERFRWLAAQTRMQIVTDGTVWHHGGGRESFVGWGYMFVNGRGYPAAPSLAELVDLARSDQGDRGTQLTAGENR